MIKGIYSAASAMVAGTNKQALKVHNIANLDTPGFKEVFSTLVEFNKTDVIPNHPATLAMGQASIGKLGLGVMTSEPRTNFADGQLKATDQNLDFALQGSGFFRIMTPEGERLTRDGRFSRDANGTLVTVDGNQVLNENGSPIKLPDGDALLGQNGEIRISGNRVTRLGIAEFDVPTMQLIRDEGNIFRSLIPITQSTINTSIHQGYLESSNVNAVDFFTGVSNYKAAQIMIQNQDELLGKTISVLGKQG